MLLNNSIPFVGDTVGASSGTLKASALTASNGTTGVDLLAAETGVSFAVIYLVVKTTDTAIRELKLLDGTTVMEPALPIPAPASTTAGGVIVFNVNDLCGGRYKTTAGNKLAFKLDGGTTGVSVGCVARRV